MLSCAETELLSPAESVGSNTKTTAVGKCYGERVRESINEKETAREAKVKRSISFLSYAALSSRPGESITWMRKSFVRMCPTDRPLVVKG
jgi:hypothetical protein